MHKQQTELNTADDWEEQEPTFADLVLALALHHGRTFFRRSELAQFFGNSDDLAEECIGAGWLVPAFSGNRLAGFNIIEIGRCLERLRAEGRPQTKHSSGAGAGGASTTEEIA